MNETIKELWCVVKNGIQSVMLADENLLALTRTDQDITEALSLADEAWQHLDQTQKDFLRACSRGE